MEDTISRAAVQEMIDRIGGMYSYRQIGNRDSYSPYNEGWTDAICRVDAELNSLPSAQKTQLSTEDTTFDCIYRQAAIDALDQIFDRCEEIEAHLPEGDPDRTGYKMYPDYMTVWKYLHQLPSAQPEIIRCKECKHFHYDMPYVIQGIPVLAHEACDFWSDGCKTSENGFCYYAERRTDE